MSQAAANAVICDDVTYRFGEHVAVNHVSLAIPTALMPGWLQAISRVNPLSYEVDALRGLLIGVPTTLWLDVAVLIAAAAAGIAVSSALLPRLAK